MGCDIHVCIQRQEPDGTWNSVRFYTNWWPAPEERKEGVPVAPAQLYNRNYNLFGILAGIKMGDGWPSIAPDRGFPEGFNPDADDRWMGDHSFTWLTLDELRAFDWHGTGTRLYGVVSAEEFESLKPGERPRSFSGSVSGRDVEVYTPATYHLRKHQQSLAKAPYVQIEWFESAADVTGWPDTVIPWLEQLAKGRPLRLVLGFDS